MPDVQAEYDITLWLLLLAVLLLPVDIGVRRLVVSRRELAELVAALALRRPARAAREPVTPLVGALRQRRAQRESVPLHAISGEASQYAAPKIAPSIRGVGNERRMRSRSVRNETSAGGAAPTGHDAEGTEDQSLAARLLAAKRRKQ